MTQEQQTQLDTLKAAAFDAGQAVIAAQTAWQASQQAYSANLKALQTTKAFAEKAVKDFEVANGN